MDFTQALRNEERTLVESACEGRSRALYVGSGRLLCRVLTKYLLYVAAEDTSLTPHLAMSGYWEMWVTQAVARNVKAGWRCFDVGANVGYYSVLLADLVGDGGAVVAVEPQARLAGMIDDNATINGVGDRLSVVCAALGDEEGTAYLRVPGNQLGSAHVVDPGTPGGIDVQSRTLDGLGPERVEFMKVDAEGAEAALLKGAEKTLARDRPVLLLEFGQTMAAAGGEAPTAHVRALVEGGYRLQIVDTAGRLEDTTVEKLEKLGEREISMLWLSPKS